MGLVVSENNSSEVAVDYSKEIYDNMIEAGKLMRKMFYGFEEIGEGGFGKVYKATYHIDQKVYAIKKVKLFLNTSQPRMS